MAVSVTRALQAIRKYGAQPEQIDQAILASINVTLARSYSPVRNRRIQETNATAR